MRLNCPQKDIWISLICAHLQDLIINAKSVENLSNQIYSVKKIKSDITWLVPTGVQLIGFLSMNYM